MKSFTDIDQSKKLASILTLDSADMKFPYFGDGQYGTTAVFGEPLEFSGGKDIPCWSLAALLEVIREKVGYDLSVWDKGYSIDVYDLESGKVITELYSNPVDAVVETIYKLREKELI